MEIRNYSARSRFTLPLIVVSLVSAVDNMALSKLVDSYNTRNNLLRENALVQDETLSLLRQAIDYQSKRIDTQREHMGYLEQSVKNQGEIVKNCETVNEYTERAFNLLSQKYNACSMERTKLAEEFESLMSLVNQSLVPSLKDCTESLKRSFILFPEKDKNKGI